MNRPAWLTVLLCLVAPMASAQDIAPPPPVETNAPAEPEADSATDADADADADADSATDADADADADADPDANTATDLDPEAPPDIVLHLTVDTGDGVATGELIHVTITASVPEGDDVGVPEQGFGAFELFDERYTDAPTANGQRRQYTFELDLLALEPGELELPALRLRVVTAEGEVGTARTEPQTITINSHIANEPDAAPRPPTEPVQVFEEDYTLAWALGILGALLLTALIAFFVGRWWRRRPKAAAPPPPPRPPWEVALEQLEAVRAEQRALIAEGKHVELVDRISDAVREYLGKRYDFNGLESTSDEVVGRLRKVKLRRIKLDDIKGLLSDSDLVKFAKAIPDAEQCSEMLEAAIHIVRATTPSGDLLRRTTPERKTKRSNSGDGTTRVVTKTGEIVLPLAVHTLDEARDEIGSAVGAAVRDMDAETGQIRVAMSPALPHGEETNRTLREIHDQLASELDEVRTGSGTSVRLVIELYHSRLMDARAGETVDVTIVDDEGARVEQRTPKGKAPDAAAKAQRGAGVSESASPSPSDSPSETNRLRVTAAALPEALTRVVPAFFVKEPGLSQPLVRWVTGVPRPVAYQVETEEGPVLFASGALRGLRVSRSELHDRALANMRRTIPQGFAPTEDPAFLDGGAAALLVLPGFVPTGETWLAYPDEDGALVVMREHTASTDDELRRLAKARTDDALFEKPVRVKPKGFEPTEWPEGVSDRRTDPGHSDPRGEA